MAERWIYETAGGRSITLSDSGDPGATFVAASYSGFGVADLELDDSPRSNSRSGAIVNRSRYGPRRMRIDLEAYGDDAAGRERAFDALLAALDPDDGTGLPSFGTLRRERHDGAVRAIRCAVVGGWSLGRDAYRRGWHFRLPLEFYAPSPFFHDPARQTAAFGRDSGGMRVPSRVPTAMGTGTERTSLDLAYNGSAAHDGLEWRADGPVTNPSLRSLRTGETAAFELIVPSGATLAVRMGGGPSAPEGNFSATMQNAGQLHALTLASSPIRLLPGLNRLIFAETSGQSAPSSSVSYHEEHLRG